jgi:hypothetical protein
MWFKPYGHVVEMWPLEQSLHQEALTCITSTSHENSMKLHCIRLHTVAYTVAHIQMHTYIIIIYIYTYYINIFTTYIFIYVCRNAHAQTYLYIYAQLLSNTTTTLEMFHYFLCRLPPNWFDLVERSCPVVPCLHRTANLAPEFFLSGPLFHPAIGQENDSVAFLVHMSCKEEAINAFSALNGKSIMRGRGCQR